MYYYVELMRAQRGLRVVGILLGLFILTSIVVRLWFLHAQSPTALADEIEHSPTAHVTHTQLADGSIQTTVDDPANRAHAVIVRKGRAIRLTLTEPDNTYRAHHDSEDIIGSRSVSIDKNTGMAHVSLSFEHQMDFDLGSLLLVSLPMGLLVATMLGAPLAKENDGHLDLAWTKPVSREAYALATVGIDAAAIVISQLLFIAVLLLCTVTFDVPSLAFGSVVMMLLGLAAPLAWYALLTAAGASLRGCGLVIGLGWVAAIVIGAVAKATDGVQSAIGLAIHNVFQVLAYLDPLAYISFGDHGLISNGIVKTAAEAVIVLFVLSVLYIASAVLQWRRVEA